MKTTINGKEIKLFGKLEIGMYFTSIVQDYLSKGFVFAFGRFCGGTQGEDLRADLTKDNKTIYRIWVDEEYVHDEMLFSNYTLKVEIEKYENVSENSTLWYGHGEKIFEKIFYAIADYHSGHKMIYVENKEDALKFGELQRNRAQIRWEMKKDYLPISIPSKLLLNVIRKQKGYKSVQLKDIAQVQRRVNRGYYRIDFVGNKSPLLLELKK